ncbi:MAG: hypothetical protein AB8G14_12990 [Ilumatobacter sp.]
MTTGFALTFAALAIVFMVVGTGFGLLASSLRSGGSPRGAAFDWGMSFGPIGLVLMATVRALEGRRTRSGQPPTLPLARRSRWSPRHSGDALVTLGAGIVVVSAFLPWLRARSRTESLSFAPATEPVLAVGAWIVLGSILCGFVVFVGRRSVGVIACASAIWFNVSLLYWLLGATVATWLPAEVLPNNLTASVQAGASVGLAGSALVLVGAAIACAEQTWSIRAPRLESWTFLGGVAVALIALAGRNMAWIDITAEDFRWVLAVDAVPVFGDLISLVLLLVAASSLATAASRSRLAPIITVVAGVSTLAVAVVALGSGALVERAGDEIADQVIARDVDVDSKVEALLIAPGWFALTGLLAIVLGAAGQRRARRPHPNSPVPPV